MRRVGVEIAVLAAAMGMALGMSSVGAVCMGLLSEQPTPVVQRVYATCESLCPAYDALLFDPLFGR